VGEIFLSATPATHDAVQENARRIVEQIKSGGNFAGYARQFSEASTAAVGGDLNWIKLEQLQNPQLEGVVQQLQPGQLVGPVEIPGGFSIILLIDKRQVGMADPRDAVLSLTQISFDFPAGTSDEAARAKAAAFQQDMAQIHGCGEAQTVGQKLGYNVVTNDQMRAKDLPDALQNIILQLQVGQATPVFGDPKSGVRVLMLCGRDDPQVQSGPSPQQLQAQLEDDRIQKRAQRYLRDLRRDAVIEYN
jgi:peptidyl-prolyl cis-trans isomerase SurA